MQPRGPIETDIVLLGAGHAHVEVLRRFAKRPESGVRLTLIGREPETPYSGMLPGVIRGDYEPRQAHIDLAPLAAAAGARLILGEATAINLDARTVVVPGRPDVPFDLLAIDVGGEPAAPTDGGIAVKPIGRFLDQLRAIERTIHDHDRIVVVGGGPGGVELALALAYRYRSRYRIALVSGSPEPLIDAPDSARRVAVTAMVDASVEIVRGAMGGAFQNGRLALSDGSFLDAAACLRATGVEAPSFLANSGLACDAKGCVLVDSTLRSINDPAVFAAGDCASIQQSPRPKAGVWAVRAGVHLARNLRLAARHRPLQQWRPQREALVILGLGGGRAVAWRNGLSLSGTLVWRWKDWIDRRWMRMYTGMRMKLDPKVLMRCGGCGAKVAAEVLAGALADLPSSEDNDLVVGLATPDDAAVLRVPPGRMLVQSVDHFRAFLDDPFLFGQVAAAHALSDLHAMGAQPWTALAIATVPYGPGAKMRADLSAMLQGATQVLRGDGCTLVGGHSGEADEAALGFAVSGLAEPEALTRKSGLRPGDALILTKPIGTGVVLAGHMRGLTRANWLTAAINSMRASNATAAGLLRDHGVTACTDVTGFGLAGHLAEMTRASGVAATIWRNAVPVLSGALELAAQGIESTLAPENARVVPNLSTEPRERILIDPQTSGGLLGGVPPERAEACLRALLAAGMTAAIVGVVEEISPDAPMIRIGGELGRV
ncbi:MAG: selenide, water dikinase SelD [Acetobacteraceae bacterium]|jgi:selenide,water dikinase